MKKFIFLFLIILIFWFIHIKTEKLLPVTEPVKVNLTYYLGIKVNAKKCIVILDKEEKKVNFDFNIQIPAFYNVKRIKTSFSSEVKKISNLSYEIEISTSVYLLKFQIEGLLSKNKKKYHLKKEGQILFLKPVYIRNIPKKITETLGLYSYPSIEKALERNIEYEKLKQVEEHIYAYNDVKYFYPIDKTYKNFFVVDDIPVYKFDHDKFFRENYPDFPHYIALKKQLLYKISVLKKLAEEKFFPGRIEIICGFRSPNYNLGLILGIKPKLKVFFSRHQYGDAIDFILDNDRDGIMDDLNNDSSIDIKDAYELEKLGKKAEKITNIPGGLGAYSYHDVPFRIQSPYVHMDVRGWKVRWKVE